MVETWEDLKQSITKYPKCGKYPKRWSFFNTYVNKYFLLNRFNVNYKQQSTSLKIEKKTYLIRYII